MPDSLNPSPHPVHGPGRALDMLICVTIFRSFAAQEKTEEIISLRGLAPRLRQTKAATKAALPWLKLAQFGDARTAKGSLRHDANVRAIHGIEADYDGEVMTLDRARQILTQANVAAVIYTSPSHKPNAPRWRILCPTSQSLPPDARAQLVARLNGLFLGALAGESFTLSQSYYFGHTPEASDHTVIMVEGQHIDLLHDLDAGAVHKPKPPRQEPSYTPPTSSFIQGGTPYGRRALDGECQSIRNAGEGQKHHTLNRAAYSIGGLVACGELDEGEAIGQLRAALYDIRDRCDDFRHAEQTLEVAFADGKAAPRVKPVSERATFDAGHTIRLKQRFDIETGEELPKAADGPDLPLIYFGDVQASLDASDFVEGILTEEAMSVVYGPSNCGKTFFVSDLAMHVATGRTWRGKAIEAGGVIYCALEGSHGIANRVAAWRKHYGYEGVEVPFAVVPVSINLLDPDADREKLARTVAHAAKQMGVPIKLIVIDTLSRAMAGGNENAPDDMGALVASADFIRQTCKAHICFIHHSGKDEAKGARGHSLLRAATDTEIEISRADSQAPSVARVTKQREMEIEGEFVFKLATFELGTNRRGKPVTSCIVEAVEGQAAVRPKRPIKLPPGVAVCLRALDNALCEHGRTRAPAQGVPLNVLTVTDAEWRNAFYGELPDENANARRMAFTRGVTKLKAENIAGFASGLAWLVKNEKGSE